ncbi:hypothetical protein [Synechococcus sp. MIT S1220]|uniref:hypothetical protein n=1 Tax=Synechococcus sp. MIT S1220 TaxID=3082549 RepID=UPI0039AF6F7E
MTAPTDADQGQSGDLTHASMNFVKLLPSVGLLLGLPVICGQPVFAQSEGWLLGPGSNLSNQSDIVPTNCVTDLSGAITCDTKVVNPPSNTPARPYYNPFNN